MPKGTSWAKATLKILKIRFVALAVVLSYACLKELVNQAVSQKKI